MKIIEDYLNTLYVNNNSIKVQELKEEIEDHLLTYVDEFLQQGYNLNDAQNKAIYKFGNVNESLIELSSIYKNKIDIKKEYLKKLCSLRWKVVNIFGWLLAATFFTAHTLVPTWLLILLYSSCFILIIISFIILFFQKKYYM